ncbi:MAG: hypothetical protein SGPRY_008394, partial [Prymnesium sp.]
IAPSPLSPASTISTAPIESTKLPRGTVSAEVPEGAWKELHGEERRFSDVRMPISDDPFIEENSASSLASNCVPELSPPCVCEASALPQPTGAQEDPQDGRRGGSSKFSRELAPVDPHVPSIADDAHELPQLNFEKTAANLKRVSAAVADNPLFLALTESQRDSVFRSMFECKCTAGQEIIRQGEQGDLFFVVESGEYEAWKVRCHQRKLTPKLGTTAHMAAQVYAGGDSKREEIHEPLCQLQRSKSRDQSKSFKHRFANSRENEFHGVLMDGGTPSLDSGTLRSPEFYRATMSPPFRLHVYTYSGEGSFGELALLFDCARAASIVCTKPGILWAIGRFEFKQILMATNQSKHDDLREFCKSTAVFSTFKEEQMNTLLALSHERVVGSGEAVWRVGEVVDKFILVRQVDPALSLAVRATARLRIHV